MKKILLYLFLFILICFILPALLTRKVSEKSTEETLSVEKNDSENIENAENRDTSTTNTNDVPVEYKYNNYGTIKLLHTKNEEVEEIPIDEYLYGVVSAEMPATFEKEALKAQAIVARTYTIYKIQNKKHEIADICDSSSCCQAWISKEDRFARWEEDLRESNWKKIQEAVDETKGKIITYENKPINAFFHSNSGGITEIPVNVWGGTGYPYLQVVETAGEEGYDQYSSEVELSNEELINKLKTKYNNINIDFNNTEDIKIIELTESGRVKTVKFGNYNLSGVEVRSLLGLKSTNFSILNQDGKIKFSVKGYGHGVGMSQTGADNMAKQGKSAEEIINHFYKDIEIKDINSL